MSTLVSQWDALNQSHLQTLIDNGVHESKTIEYKERISARTDEEKKEFLADVSSFANAKGGHILFGIREINGMPIELCGLESDNADGEILRLENIIRDGIEPRIPGLLFKKVTLQGGHFIIALHTPRSWAAPHMVTFKGNSRFYARNSAGKYLLDVGEIRAAFTLSETITDRIRQFRTDRIASIVAGETPVDLLKSGKVVLHVLPLSAFNQTTQFDVSGFERNLNGLMPLRANGCDFRHNLDGFLTFSGFSEESSLSRSYLQIFRNGIIEAVESSMLRDDPSNGKIIPIGLFESEIVNGLERFLHIQKGMGLDTPIFAMLSILGVKGYTIPLSNLHHDRSQQIEKNDLIFHEALIDSFDLDASKILRPVLNTFWNAAGWPRSKSYDVDGNWRDPMRYR